MAFDEDLAWRLRAALAAAGATVTERKMFGGLAFLVGGNMCVAARGGGGLLARVGPEADAAALAEPGTSAMDMGRGPMAGWIIVDPAGVATENALNAWVARALSYAASLPPKKLPAGQTAKRRAAFPRQTARTHSWPRSSRSRDSSATA